MTIHIVLLSGPLAVGKTAVASILTEKYALKKISSSAQLRAVALDRGLEATRGNLQKIGDSLDRETNFEWLVDPVACNHIASDPFQSSWFIDAVRKPEQIAHFRARFPKVFHVHLSADEDVLRERFLGRARVGDDVETGGSYEQSVRHANEQSARSLGALADLVLDLVAITPDDAAAAIVRQSGSL